MTFVDSNSDPVKAILMLVPCDEPLNLRSLSAAQWEKYISDYCSSGSRNEVLLIETDCVTPMRNLPRDAEIVSLRRSAYEQVYVLSKNRNFIYRFLEYLRALTEEYEPPVTRALCDIVKPGWTCIDVGSHIGRISLLLGELVGPTGRVYAFDAFEPNVEDLRRLAAFKGLSSIISVTHAAVSDGRFSKLLLYAGRDESSAEWNLRGMDVSGNRTTARFEVPALALDALLGNTKVDLVKIDVEGAAAGVLSGMSKIFSRNKPAFLIEFHSQEERDAAKFLYDAGYSITDVTTGNKVMAGKEAYQCLALPP